jgi:hypothetical protein
MYALVNRLHILFLLYSSATALYPLEADADVNNI